MYYILFFNTVRIKMYIDKESNRSVILTMETELLNSWQFSFLLMNLQHEAVDQQLLCLSWTTNAGNLVQT